MLGKLFKHELKETGKYLVLSNAILIAITLLGIFILLVGSSITPLGDLFSAPFLLFYMLSIFALFLITGVYLTIHFYKTMYGASGYLTHTLPVSKTALLNTKILVSFFWVIVALFITAFSICSLVLATAGKDLDFAHIGRYFTKSLPSSMGFSPVGFYLIIASLIVVACLNTILSVFVSLSIGQLFSKHRILSSIGAYVVIYVIQQIAGIVLLAIVGFQTMSFKIVNVPNVPEHTPSVLPLATYRMTMVSGALQSLIFAIIFYLICSYIIRKKLNLE